jgi:hypothetical protein
LPGVVGMTDDCVDSCAELVGRSPETFGHWGSGTASVRRGKWRYIIGGAVLGVALVVASVAASPARSRALPSLRPPTADPHTVAPVVDTSPAKQRAVPVTVTKQSAGTETVAVPTAVATSPRTYAADGAWSWFGDPRAVHHIGVRDRTFFGWITALGDVQVAQYDHTTRQVVAATLAVNMGEDDHGNPSLILRSDRRLIVFWSGHVGRTMYFRVASLAESVLLWGPTHVLPVQLPGVAGYTYPNPVYIPQEHRLYLFWRAGTQPAVAWSDDMGASWSPARQVVHNFGQRPYLKVAANDRGGIHIGVSFGNPNETTTDSLYYARLYQGTLFHADGTAIGRLADGPVELSQFDVVQSQAQLGYKSWIHDVANDPATGNPVIVYAAFPTRTDHRYRYATWSTAARWTNHQIVAAGPAFETSGTQPYYSAGVTLDHSDPRVIYLSRKIGTVYEIERWTTIDGGATFTHAAVTSGSAQNNVRPVAPRGSTGSVPDVMWMAGSYVAFTSYSTRIVGTQPAPPPTPTRLRISLTPATVARGQTVLVGARLVNDLTGAYLAGSRLQLWVRPVGKEFLKLADGVTSSAGFVQWVRRPTSTADYEVRYAGGATRLPSVSPRIRVHLIG